MPNVQYACLQTWRNSGCHRWAQQQAYLDAPTRWTHILQEQGKSIGQTEGHESVLK
jgi:hypothetical protein